VETRTIGTSGLRASVVGLGCNNFGIFQDRAQTTACVHKALDVGITFFDMASEHGRGLEETLVADALGPRRKDVVIATKFGQAELVGRTADGGLLMASDKTREGASRRWIMRAVEESLTRLKSEYIDLYQPHVLDGETPREETLRALEDLITQGKVRAIGEAATFATVSDHPRASQTEHEPAAVLSARERPADGEVPPGDGTSARLAVREAARVQGLSRSGATPRQGGEAESVRGHPELDAASSSRSDGCCRNL
jgi:aryl-alcohol dehydrogenase-like predicted oxidoreductase